MTFPIKIETYTVNGFLMGISIIISAALYSVLYYTGSSEEFIGEKTILNIVVL
jgi:hypothetical protein